jgi:hypothetical protein
MSTEAAPRPKPRTRNVIELQLRDIIIPTSRGNLSSIMPTNANGIQMTADLDARTIGIKVPGRGTSIVPFESCKSFKYGAGVPKAD